ncbi:MAG: phosphoribosylamine--glycine ligase [Clostridia bacterium]
MKLMVVGGGGREDAIIQKLRENPTVEEIFALPGNAGIAQHATCVPIRATDLDAIVDFATVHAVDFVVVAPDDPLCMGLVDRLEKVNIPAFGPHAKAAEIEGSKVFSKQLMRKYGIPTADYAVFDTLTEALAYLQQAKLPLVVKADGLALGKGVLICTTRREAEEAVRDMMEAHRFGTSGNRVVIEAFLTGPEVSVLAFSDGETVKPMVSSMDHKRALTGDEGLNTGGMGAIAPNPYYTDEMAARCMREIFLPTLHAMRAEGRPFRGCLYFGLMLTQDGPKVIEYNCRFGDPETQVVLPLLQSDLLTILQATVQGTLAQTEVRFSSGAACCVVLASGGYPAKYETGKEISGLEHAKLTAPHVRVYHAGTRRDAANTWRTAGGRVLGVTATADTLTQAVEQAYDACAVLSFEGMHVRRDIGQRALNAHQA